jgi:hypothetical protein
MAEAYASQIEISSDFIWYCELELHLKTQSHPVNGFIPFGVNYGTISDRKRLDLIISARETYERANMQLCLANAKNAIRAAGQQDNQSPPTRR